MGTPTTNIGPGFGAFVAFFALALTLWFLMRNMNGRMRRMAYREQERVAAAEAAAHPDRAVPAAAAAEPADRPPGGADPGETADPAADAGPDQGREAG